MSKKKREEAKLKKRQEREKKAQERKESQGKGLSKYALKRKKVKSRVRRISHGKVFVKASYNNTVVTITDLAGNPLAWSAAGIVGFKGAKKATPYAAQTVVENVLQKLEKTGLKEVDVFVKGIGSGREAAIRAFYAKGIDVLSIKDTTPIPHDGCRPKKVRRV
ncbi:30S ribosomal protein S11 [bacterium (Candidatus Torokbacteria) CG_4_10_14_0_2_um_filter_35_8]|nr:MAG: 30S ribosomal protein S11 [bacterium (Candidatus Torokbacteria) CG_4_10_14_0_2_um_filter_35_8]